MDEAERLHRPDPPRDGPIRDFRSYAQGPARGAAPPHVDPIAEGVRLGYSVVEEQIRQGERLAERLRPAAGRGAASSLDFAQLLERALDVYKDLGALALAAAETLARNPAVQAGVSRAFRNDRAEPETSPHRAETAVALALRSSRRTTAKLELWQAVETFTPHVHALVAVAAGTPALAGVRFEADVATSAPVLAIDIEDAQPTGVYAGLVVDAATNAPRGTLSVTIHA